ncbi:MAG: J domain-containing protein [Planctomycetota bacterium]
MSSPLGRVLDVSRFGFRIGADKKPPFKTGETHEVVLRAGAQQIRALARVRWVRRVGLVKPRYELGFELVDPRNGVGRVVLQLGQFGCVDANGINAAATEPDGAAPAADSSTPGATGGSQTTANGSPDPAADTAGPSAEQSVEVVDLYAIIGVEPDAEDAVIRDAFRRLVLEHHPDRSEASDAAERFAQITSAYSVLRDPKRRGWYDQMRGSPAA